MIPIAAGTAPAPPRAGGRAPETGLLGREAEIGTIEALLRRATDGMAGSLVIYGETGMGKTALLDHAAGLAAERGMQAVRLAGVESESQLAYAAVHRLLWLHTDRFDRLPTPQRDNLRALFGLCVAAGVDRFLVALATLSMIADLAADQALLCAVDDADRLDPESASVLSFVARRLVAEPVALIFTTSTPQQSSSVFAGIPEMQLHGLDSVSAVRLVSTGAAGQVSAHVAHELAAQCAGNPLALLEVPRQLSVAQLSGAAPLPEPLPAGAGLQAAFSARVAALAPSERLLIALAAAEPGMSAPVLARAAAMVGADPVALSRSAEDVCSFEPEVRFHHEMARSVAYHATPVLQRRELHRALAASLADEDPARAAWHRAIATPGLDEGVAAALEEAAGRMCEGGSDSAAASFLARAGDLSPDPAARARRLVAAADAALRAGQPVRARSFVEALEEEHLASDEIASGRVARVVGEIAFATGEPERAARLLTASARAQLSVDAPRGREALLDALDAANYAGRPALEEWRAAAAGALTGVADPPANVSDCLLSGFIARLDGAHERSVDLLRRSVDELVGSAAAEQVGLRRLIAVTRSSLEIFDMQTRALLAERWVALARGRSALLSLIPALVLAVDSRARAGQLARAEDAAGEAIGLMAAAGGEDPFGPHFPALALAAWQGDLEGGRASGAAAIADAGRRGMRIGVSLAKSWLAVLELGAGDVAAALAHARPVFEEDLLGTGSLVLPELVEAAARCGERATAERAAQRLAGRVGSAGTAYGLGLVARSAALLAGNGEAERHFRRAVDLLGSAGAPIEAARTRLLLGEWLAARRRRGEACAELGAAYRAFVDMGVAGFAARAERALAAAGGSLPARESAGRPVLTAQESEVARLAAEGATNREIAAKLFVSPATIDYHLRKVFKKLDVRSRTELARVLVALPAE
jgi:DNA-binding CsgD family transcriptional regulator